MNSLKVLPLAFTVVFLAAPHARASGSICDAVVGNLVMNCGFELGAYSSTLGGYTNNSVPLYWVANAGFDLEPSYNHIQTGVLVNSGSQSLSISNYDYQPVATLSQTITDVAGSTYSGSFYAFDGGANGDGNAYLQMQVNGVAKVALDDTVSTYTQYDFSFVGTGSDTLTIAAQTNPSEWYVDDVVLTGASPAPEPGEILPVAFGMALLLSAALRRRLARTA
jgi:hypothetical protein